MPNVLRAYGENVKRHGHRDVAFVIVGDKKTPAATGAFVASLQRKFNLPFHYFDIRRQLQYLRRFPALKRHIPYNSFSRRNIGDLWAYEQGADIVIRIDDDNFPAQDDFIRGHLIVGQKNSWPSKRTGTGWYNNCELLACNTTRTFYPRGFPYSQRWQKTKTIERRRQARVVVNEGLWIGNPDVDAITRLSEPVDVAGPSAQWKHAHYILESGIWCPINTQNTAFARDVLPCAFVSPYAGRYDDILMGYLMLKIIDHMGDAVAYGRPLLRQNRNAHNLWKDLSLELDWYTRSETLLKALREIKLTRRGYGEAYRELAESLERCLGAEKKPFEPLIKGMKIWSDCVMEIGS